MQINYSLNKRDVLFSRLVYAFQNKMLLVFALLLTFMDVFNRLKISMFVSVINSCLGLAWPDAVGGLKRPDEIRQRYGHVVRERPR